MTNEETKEQLEDIYLITRKEGASFFSDMEEEKKIKHFVGELTEYVDECITDALNQIKKAYMKENMEIMKEIVKHKALFDRLIERIESTQPENSNLTKDILETEKRTYVIRGCNLDDDYGCKEVYTTLRGAKLIAAKLYGHLAAYVSIQDKKEGVIVDERTYGEKFGNVKWVRPFYNMK